MSYLGYKKTESQEQLFFPFDLCHTALYSLDAHTCTISMQMILLKKADPHIAQLHWALGNMSTWLQLKNTFVRFVG